VGSFAIYVGGAYSLLRWWVRIFSMGSGVICVLSRTRWIGISGAGNGAACLIWGCWASIFSIRSSVVCVLFR